MTTSYNTPKLAFDFTDGALSSLVTFTRATSASNPATYVSSNGLVVAATNNEPRFDYDPVSLVRKGLLIEESRENLVLNSGQMQLSWVPDAASSTLVGDDAVSPDGTTTATKIVESATTAVHSVRYAITPVSGVTYTYSIYAKADERSVVRLYGGVALSSLACRVNLLNGSVQQGSPVVSNLGNGWWRISVSGVASSSSASQLFIALYNVGGSYAGDGVSGLHVWGAQLEAGASVTSYIPTTSAALTRNADVAAITGTNFSDWWQAGRGGVSVSAIPSTVGGTRPLVQFDDNTADNLIALQGNTTNPELYIVDSTTPQAQIDAGTIAAGTPYTLTGWWQTDFCAARLNNNAKVIDNSATIPTVTQARLGSDGTNYLNGHLATINYYDQFSSRIYIRRKNKAVFSVL